MNDAIQLRQVSKKIDAIQTNALLEGLPRAKTASCLSKRGDTLQSCFVGTRTVILKNIADWLEDRNPTTPRLYFLNGIAGIGKTTIARTVVQHAVERGLPVGNFFFSRQGGTGLRDPTLVFPTLAYQLACVDSAINTCFTHLLQHDPQVGYAALNLQAEGFFVKAFSALPSQTREVVLVVLDALDESEERGAKELLQHLIRIVPSSPFLKVLITGRPEPHITSVLSPTANSTSLPSLETVILHDIESSVVQTDIRTYLKAELAKVPRELDLQLPPNWATDEEIAALTRKAGLLFVYAATAVRFIADNYTAQPRKQLKILLDHAPAACGARPFWALDLLYLQLLSNSLGPQPFLQPDLAKQIQLVVGTVVTLRDPLLQDALGRLIKLEVDEVASTLRRLRSVIISSDNVPPRTFHPSFPDFIQDNRRCTDNRFLVCPQESERRLAEECLKRLIEKLRKGMLGPDLDFNLVNSEVPDLEGRVARAFPSELRYACRFWASHLDARRETSCSKGCWTNLWYDASSRGWNQWPGWGIRDLPW